MLWNPTLLVWCLLFILKGVFYCQAAVDYNIFTAEDKVRE